MLSSLLLVNALAPSLVWAQAIRPPIVRASLVAPAEIGATSIWSVVGWRSEAEFYRCLGGKPEGSPEASACHISVSYIAAPTPSAACAGWPEKRYRIVPDGTDIPHHECASAFIDTISLGSGDRIYPQCFIGPMRSYHAALDRFVLIHARTETCFCEKGYGFDKDRNVCTAAPSKLTIRLNAPTEFEPTFGSAAPAYKQVVATVTENGSPKAGVSVRITTGVTDAQSGGHLHRLLTPRPDVLLKVGTAAPAAVATGVTDGNGRFTVQLAPPKAAGRYHMDATCSDCENTAHHDYVVKVPNLREWTDTPGRSTSVGQLPVHPRGRWFTETATTKLEAVLDVMIATGWGVVGVNDGSLEWGGTFDTQQDWASRAHAGHNRGKEVDLSFRHPGPDRTEKQKNDAFDKLCEGKGVVINLNTLWHKADGADPHFHLYLEGGGITSRAPDGRCCVQNRHLDPLTQRFVYTCEARP